MASLFRGGDAWKAYYKGRHVLITGASEGVGLELARMLVPAGARVSLLARTEAKLRAAEAACLEAARAAGVDVGESDKGSGSGNGGSRDHPRVTCVVPADVTDERAVAAAVFEAEAALGEVDVLLCCAGAAECGELLRVGECDCVREGSCR